MKLSNDYLPACFILMTSVTFAQNWQFAVNGSDPMPNRGVSVATGGKNSVFIHCKSGSTNLQHPCAKEGNSLINYDTLGNIQWLRTYHTDFFLPDAKSLSADAAGNAYVSGGYGDVAQFCGGSGPDTFLFSQGNDLDGYVAKYDGQGDLKWARSYGYAVSKDYIWAVKPDHQGNVFITGNCAHYTNAVLYNENFIAKLDSLGNSVWLKTSNWKGNATPIAMEVDQYGNCYIAGMVIDSAIFGQVTLTTTAILGDIFLACYDPAGNVAFAKKLSSGPNGAEVTSMSLDHSGGLYITGRYFSPAAFDTITVTGGGTNGNGGMFILRADTSGNVAWVRKSDASFGWGIAADEFGRAYVTGRFNIHSCNFSGGTNTITVTHNKTNHDLYVARYDISGQLDWVVKPGGHGTRDNMGTSIAGDGKNNWYVTGFHGDTMILGSNQVISTSGQDNFFLARFTEPGPSTVGSGRPPIPGSCVMYPNPSSGELTIDLTGSPGKEAAIQVHSVLGQLVHKQTTATGSGRITITLPAEIKGICIVSVKVGSNGYRQRVIIK